LLIPQIERKKVSSQLIEQLKELIKKGTFPPKSKLPSEKDLAKMFGVSRSPIREALSVLEASGLVESRQGEGTFVKEIHLANMLDSVTFDMIEIEQVYNLLEMRTVLETEAAAFAALRATEDDLVKIKSALDEIAENMVDDYSIGSEADFQFHHEIVSASHNPFILQSIENLKDLYKRSLNYSLKRNVGLREKREQIYQEHLKIYESIYNKDAAAAAYHMKRHLNNARIKLGDKRVGQIEKN